jgi:catechol 2,3-dioxygenase-like lactoylglutathione lyase family enzyme
MTPLPIDHVAVPCNDIAGSVRWYRESFGAEVLYEDETWAFLQMGDVKLALVTPTQHPPHVALRVDADDLDRRSAEAGVEVDEHRDGTRGIYLKDPDGNAIELISYPPGRTPYE